MIKIIDDLPDNILGVSAAGEITTNDYESILMPALDTKLKTHKTFRLLYHLGSYFKGIEFGAMYDDAKIAFKHISKLEPVALVSDQKMINSISIFLSYLISFEFKLFNNTEFESAKKCISE